MGSLKEVLEVVRLSRKDIAHLIIDVHYAQRMPSISYAFGLKENGELIGCVTYGKPASPPLCNGICGVENRHRVYELNRLVLVNNKKNYASYFVSKTLNMLKDNDLIIVSFSDTGMNHHGYVYQSCNFIYTGCSSSRTDKYTENGKHPRHYNEENKHLRVVRTPKHRYIYFTGKSRKKLMDELRYEIKDYPKGDNKNYIPGEKQKRTVINTLTGKTFLE